MSREPPSFDLIVATVGRVDELDRLFRSLEAQKYPRLRVIVVDQNDDAPVEALVGDYDLDLLPLRSKRGLSRARNVGLERVTADIVAFPDDDCVYPRGLLDEVARRFDDDPQLDGLTGMAADERGSSSESWKRDGAVLADDNLWNRAISFTIFLRRGVVERVGAFDERLGLGSPEPWSSGEEIDYLVRAIRLGSRVEYDPSLVVHHEVAAYDAALAFRDGASVGYLLRKHRYPARSVARMLVRPAGGALRAAIRRDGAGARLYASSLHGRLTGLRARAAK